MVKINIKIGNKTFYTSVLLLAILVISGISFAYNANWQTSPGAPPVMGHTPDEIEGLEDYIRGIVNDEVGGYSLAKCDQTPIFESGVAFMHPASKYNDGIRNVPSSCKSDTGCVIKQEIYIKKGNSSVLKLVKQYDYLQTGNKWTSTYRTGLHVNGDSKYTDIIPPVRELDDRKLYLKDDYYVKGKTDEKDENKWIFIDRSTKYGMKVYICSPTLEEV